MRHTFDSRAKSAGCPLNSRAIRRVQHEQGTTCFLEGPSEFVRQTAVKSHSNRDLLVRRQLALGLQHGNLRFVPPDCEFRLGEYGQFGCCGYRMPTQSVPGSRLGDRDEPVDRGRPVGIVPDRLPPDLQESLLQNVLGVARLADTALSTPKTANASRSPVAMAPNNSASDRCIARSEPAAGPAARTRIWPEWPSAAYTYFVGRVTTDAPGQEAHQLVPFPHLEVH